MKPADRPALLIGTWAAGLSLAVLPFDFATGAKNLCLAVVALCAVRLYPGGQAVRNLPLLPAFILWLATALASLAWSHDAGASLDAIWRDIVKTGLIFASFFVIAWRGASPAAIARPVLIGASVFSALAIFDFRYYGGWDNPHSPPRYDVAVAALDWCAFLVLAVPDLRTLPRSCLRIAPVAATLAALLCAGYLTGSRSFVLAVVLGVLLLAGLHIRRTGWAALPRSQRLAGAIVLGLTAVASIVAIKDSRPNVLMIGDRQILYGRVLDKIGGNLWLGTGFGHETDRAWYHLAFRDLPDWAAVLGGITHPHNLVLSYMDQMGVWGLAVLLVLFGSLILPLLAASRKAAPHTAVIGYAGLLLVLFTVISNSFNFYFARQHQWLLFAELGLFFGWLRHQAARE